LEPQTKYKLAVFDFDGTLADTFPWALSMMDHFMDEFGFGRVTPEEIDELRGTDPRTLMKRFSVPIWKLPSITSYVCESMARDAGRLPLFPGVGEMLGELFERGIELALVTTNTYANVSKVLGPENLSRFHYFECGVNLLGKDKKLKKILHKCDLQPQECIAIGDEIRDIQAAKKAGVVSGAVAWGYNTGDSLKKYAPDLYFERVEEIPGRV
jgi:phosphoglycolate phosphatase